MGRNRKSQSLMFCSVVLCCVALLTPATAAITPLYENAASETNYDASVSATDLVNTGQATLSSAVSTRSPSFGKAGTTGAAQFNPTGLYDGTSIAQSNTTNSFYPNNTMPTSVTFRLNTATNTNGYNLTSIQTIAGWFNVNSTQANQKYELLVSQVGSPTFKSLGTYTYTPFSSGTAASSTSIMLTDSLGALGTNIDAVRFNLAPHGVNGNNASSGTVYREIDVFGIASTTSAPTFVNLVQNGSFEADAITAGTSSLRNAGTPVNGWTITGNQQLANATFNTAASDGNQWLSLEANLGGVPNSGTISQTIATVPGQEYELSFDYNILNSSSGSVTQPWKMTYAIDGVSTELSLTNTAVNQVLSAWQHQSVSFVATSSSTLLSFTGNAQISGYYGMAIDNVAVVTVVPEPGTMIVLLGLLAVGMTRRKNRARICME